MHVEFLESSGHNLGTLHQDGRPYVPQGDLSQQICQPPHPFLRTELWGHSFSSLQLSLMVGGVLRVICYGKYFNWQEFRSQE